MGFLLPKAKSNAASQPAVTGLSIQTSAYGMAIPIVYGTTRVSCNLLWFANFQSHPGNTPSSGGGKGGITGGGGKGGDGTSATTYSCDLMMGLCEGPISQVGNMWVSQTEMLPATAGIGIFTGAYGQGVWPYLQDNYPGEALAYSGIAGGDATSYDLGNSASLPNFNFEVYGVFAGSAPNDLDADPSQVVPDLLSNPHYGLGFPATRIGALATNSEAHGIPSSAPYQITVTGAAAYEFNLCVVDDAGAIYGSVVADPGPGQYTVDYASGLYGFNAADAGAAITIRYAALGGLDTYRSFTLASGLWISPAYAQQAQAASMLDDIATATHADFVWSSGVLTLVPRGTVAIDANGYSYTPVGEPLFDLSDDDFMPNTSPTGTVSAAANDDPVILTRLRASDQINDIKIEALDRNNQYAATIAEVTDQALIDTYGRRGNGSKSLHLFVDANAANVSAQLQMQDQYIRNTYSIQLDQRYCVLDPGDIVSLTDNGLGLARQWARVLSITENDDGTLSVSLEEYPAGTGAAAEYSLATGKGYRQDYNQDPGVVNPPIVFAFPVALAGNQGLAIGIGLSGANPALWGGCSVYASGDGDSYRLIGTQIGPARMGMTTADFPVGGDPDTTDTLHVDLSRSAGALAGGTAADADAANTLCLIAGAAGVEYVSYSAATLTGPNAYALGGYIRRGQYGSSSVDHPAGSPFLRLDQAIFQFPYQASQIGSALYLKFTSFNLWEGGEEQLAEVEPYVVSLPSPPPPGNVTGFEVAQVDNACIFRWDALPDYALKGYDILYGPEGGDIAGATFLTEGGAGTEMTNADVPPGSWVFYCVGRDIAGQVSAVPATYTIAVVNQDDLIAALDYGPAWNSAVYFDFGTPGDIAAYALDMGSVTATTPDFLIDLGSMA